MQQFHRLGTVLVILWFVLLAVVFLVVRPELAYSYGHWFHDLVGNLPVLTEVLSLPVLGPAFSSPTDGYSAGFWLAWGFLFLPPLFLTRQLWAATDLSALLVCLFWGAAYVLLAIILAVWVAFGLWLPFSVA